MCDYSLHLVASRPAKVGDKLVTTKFNNSMTRGFTAAGEPTVAVCLLPGTEVAFDREVEYHHLVASLPARASRIFSRKPSGRVARFRQVNKDEPNVHHDALEFADGHIVLLTLLCEGQRATVLQLPAVPLARREQDVAREASAASPGGQPAQG